MLIDILDYFGKEHDFEKYNIEEEDSEDESKEND